MPKGACKICPPSISLSTHQTPAPYSEYVAGSAAAVTTTTTVTPTTTTTAAVTTTTTAAPTTTTTTTTALRDIKWAVRTEWGGGAIMFYKGIPSSVPPSVPLIVGDDDESKKADALHKFYKTIQRLVNDGVSVWISPMEPWLDEKTKWEGEIFKIKEVNYVKDPAGYKTDASPDGSIYDGFGDIEFKTNNSYYSSSIRYINIQFYTDDNGGNKIPLTSNSNGTYDPPNNFGIVFHSFYN